MALLERCAAESHAEHSHLKSGRLMSDEEPMTIRW
jgi:hypothetical protein